MEKSKDSETLKIFIVSDESQLKIWKKIKSNYYVVVMSELIKKIFEFTGVKIEKSVVSDKVRELVLLSLLPKVNLNLETLKNFLIVLDRIYTDENNEVLNQTKEMSENQQKLFIVFRELFSKWQEYLLQNNLLDKIQFLKESIQKIKSFSHEKNIKLFPANTTIELHDSINKVFPEFVQLLDSFSIDD